MVVGAAIGGVVNAVQQYNQTGHVDLGQAATAATQGALIGGAVVIVAVAAIAIAPLAGAAATAALADGNPTNEISAASQAVGEVTPTLENAVNQVSNDLSSVVSTTENTQAVAINPIAGTSYSEKVLQQSTWTDFHGFPEHVDAFGVDGNTYQQVGGDGNLYTYLEIPGGYQDAEGVFRYIIGPNGIINHRAFEKK